MGKALQRRNLLLQKRIKLKKQARKYNAPARGIELQLQESNRVVLDGILHRLAAEPAKA